VSSRNSVFGALTSSDQPIRVAIVEDSNEFRTRFELLINASLVCKVVGSAATGAEGLALVKAGGYDVLLCDIDLPDFSGTEVIRASAVKNRAAEIMVISLFGDEDSVMTALAAGAKGYILKDELPENFIPIIQDIHAGNSPISSKITRGLLNHVNFSLQGIGRPSPLTARETVILKMLATGMPLKKVAIELKLSVLTIGGYTKSIYGKLGVNSKMLAANVANSEGWLG